MPKYVMNEFKIDFGDETIHEIVSNDTSKNEEMLEKVGELSDQIRILQEILSEKKFGDLKEEHFYQLKTTLDSIVNLPDEFFETNPIIEIFIDMYHQFDDIQIRFYCLSLILETISKSKLALDILIQSNPNEILLCFLDSKSIPTSNNEKDILIVVLNIISKISVIHSNSFFQEAIPMLFEFTISIFELSKTSTFLQIEQNKNILWLCFKIFKKIIYYSSHSEIIPFLDHFFVLSQITASNSIFQRYSIMILYHLVKKGFLDKVLKSEAFQTCLNLFDNYKTSDFLVILLVQILTIIDDRVKSGQFTFDLDLNEMFQLPLIIENFIKANDNEKLNFFPLFRKIAEMGLIDVILNTNHLSSNFIVILGEYHSFQLRSNIFRLLWIGLFNLNSLEEKLNYLNSELFIALATFPDIQDDLDLYNAIFGFLTHAFTLLPYNSQLLEESLVLTEVQLTDETQHAIDFFVENCLNDENEEINQLAIDYVESIQTRNRI